MVMTHLDQKRWDLFSEHLLPGWRAHDREAAAELESGFLLPQAPEDQTSPHRGTHLLVTARQDALVGWHDQLALLQHYPHMSAAIIKRRRSQFAARHASDRACPHRPMA